MSKCANYDLFSFFWKLGKREAEIIKSQLLLEGKSV